MESVTGCGGERTRIRLQHAVGGTEQPAKLEVVIELLSSDVKASPGALVLIEDWGGAGALEALVRLVS